MPTFEAMFEVIELSPWGQPDEEDEQRMQIFKDAGWPGDEYKPRQAIRETLRWMQPAMLEMWPWTDESYYNGGPWPTRASISQT